MSPTAVRTVPPDVSVLILSWNCADILRETLVRLGDEVRRVPLEVIVWDQASTDGSQDIIRSAGTSLGISVKMHMSNHNVGNSSSRNWMMSRASGKYLLMLDCDITLVRRSVERMRNFLDTHPNFGIIAFPMQSEQSQRTTDPPPLPVIEDFRICSGWAPSQYGMFRRTALAGMGFPEWPPFDRPGWGAEDDILGIGLVDARCSMAVLKCGDYLHRAHSSITLLENSGAGMNYIARCAAMAAFSCAMSPSERMDALRPARVSQPLMIESPVRIIGGDGTHLQVDIAMSFFSDCLRATGDTSAEHVVVVGGPTAFSWPAIVGPAARNVTLLGCSFANMFEVEACKLGKAAWHPPGVHVTLFPAGQITLDAAVKAPVGTWDGIKDHGIMGPGIMLRYNKRSWTKATSGRPAIHIAAPSENTGWRPASSRQLVDAVLNTSTCMTADALAATAAIGLGCPTLLLKNDIAALDIATNEVFSTIRTNYGSTTCINFACDENNKFGHLDVLAKEWLYCIAQTLGNARFGRG